ncbi:hypothetical protein [Deinococcus soli (ex Cha et al. 2016)]|uniref:Uncharacterized protein n=2 Tax=Deinococcus soli (ex Cha et al. 2016) TaxID=1309411 RepID=A0AAE3XBB3_9DEIO|nr:hypothetical protein [Deinococcus soli (ex Cha et al. 2016)]MDR6218322.1 hypothetical protein [Deinococcus soli (ex Cha et al. 2016)]MDR6329062.1 hypothetical protein [Deinococcus soli (ex Cha et al. 2016)]MDR6751335.1 hypothetical protein [Deinococcus soli (ex Cha et al. 2016)]
MTLADPRFLHVTQRADEEYDQRPEGGELTGDRTLVQMLGHQTLWWSAYAFGALRADPDVPADAPLVLVPDAAFGMVLGAVTDPGDGVSVLTVRAPVYVPGETPSTAVPLRSLTFPPGRIVLLVHTDPWSDPTELTVPDPPPWRPVSRGVRMVTDEFRQVAPGQPRVTAASLQRDVMAVYADAERQEPTPKQKLTGELPGALGLGLWGWWTFGPEVVGVTVAAVLVGLYMCAVVYSIRRSALASPVKVPYSFVNQDPAHMAMRALSRLHPERY